VAARFNDAAAFLVAWGVLCLPHLQAGLGDPERAWRSVVLVEAGRYSENICNQGSGVVVATGKIVTNFHVVEGKPSIRIFPRGKQSMRGEAAYVLRVDPRRDLALLGTAANLPAISPAPESSVAVDKFVHAIGYPGGSRCLSSGRISGIANRGNCLMVQTSAEINPGNSGGALVDEDGLLVGINTQIVHYADKTLPVNEAVHVREVQAFAIGTSAYRPLSEDTGRGESETASLPRPSFPGAYPGLPGSGDAAWRSPGTLPRIPATGGSDQPPPAEKEKADAGPLMGAVFQECHTPFATLNHLGAKLVKLDPGGAAEHAGLRLGDIIMVMDDIPVGPVRSFALAVRAKKPGGRVELQLLREGLYKEVVVILGNQWRGTAELPRKTHPRDLNVDDCPPQHDRGRLGLMVGPCPAYLRLPAEAGSLRVLSVTPGLSADRAGIREGDVILGLNGKAPGNSYLFVLQLYALRAGECATLTITRKGKTENIRVTVGWGS